MFDRHTNTFDRYINIFPKTAIEVLDGLFKRNIKPTRGSYDHDNKSLCIGLAWSKSKYQSFIDMSVSIECYWDGDIEIRFYDRLDETLKNGELVAVLETENEFSEGVQQCLDDYLDGVAMFWAERGQGKNE